MKNESGANKSIGDLISRSELKKAFEKVYPLATNEMGGVVNKQIYEIIDNAPTVNTVNLEKQSFIDGFKKGCEHGQIEERPQGEWKETGYETGALGITYKEVIELIEALDLAIKALEFIDENFPKTFDDYLKGEEE